MEKLAEGDVATADDLYHRAAKSARRIGFYTGAVDALLRQVGILRERGDLGRFAFGANVELIDGYAIR